MNLTLYLDISTVQDKFQQDLMDFLLDSLCLQLIKRLLQTFIFLVCFGIKHLLLQQLNLLWQELCVFGTSIKAQLGRMEEIQHLHQFQDFLDII